MRIWVATGLMIALAGAGAAFGQTEGTGQTPTFRAGIDLLTVDVSVVGSNGEPVSDLHAPEFVVRIAGEPRRVVSAEFISFDEPDARRRPDPIDTPFYSTNQYSRPGRLIVIVVDQSHLRLGALQPLRLAVSRFLDGLGPADRVAFVTIPTVGPQVDFTNDFDRIREAVGRVTGGSSGLSSHRISLTEAITLARRGGGQVEVVQILDRECAGEYPPGSRIRELCEREVIAEAENLLRDVRHRTSATLSALSATIGSLRDIDGPKSVLFISEGLVTEENPGETTGLGALAAAARASVNVLLLEHSGVDASRGGIPTTPERDRDRAVHGLELVAGASRGALFRVIGTGEGVFHRLQRELSAYYLLGVEATAADRDGKVRRIDVEVRRRNVTVRSRREFVEATAAGASPSTERAVAAAIRSPVPATEIPLRLTSYAFRDAATGNVRLVLAGEVADPAPEATEYAFGLALFDREGRSLVTHAGALQAGGSPERPVTYSGALIVEPGTYKVKLAVVDEGGRRGSVEHVAHAWNMDGEAFAMSDLMLADPRRSGDAFAPEVAVHVESGQLVGFLELYADAAGALDRARVTFEIAGDESGAALTAVAAELRPGQPGRREARAQLSVDLLPPGSYVARAVVTTDEGTVGALARPFTIPAGAAAAAGEALIAPPPAWGDIDFEPGVVLEPEVLGYFLDRLTKNSPAAGELESIVTRVRQGRFDGVAREALVLGDQPAALFLRGLELYAQQQLDQAAMQFRNAAALGTADRVPAMFFLGACFAASGKDGEAAQLWAGALLEQDLPAAVYDAIGNAWLRLGDPVRAVDPLRRAADGGADADRLRRVGLALAAANMPAEAVASFDAYLIRHPDDADALFAAVRTLYAAAAAGTPVSSPAEDRARAERYARAYRAANGPQQALVDQWADFISRMARE